MSLLKGLPGDLFAKVIGNQTFLHPQWQSWFNQAHPHIASITDANKTAARPTVGLWVGRQYMDTDLGKPIYVQSLNPTVWVDATGTPV